LPFWEACSVALLKELLVDMVIIDDDDDRWILAKDSVIANTPLRTKKSDEALQVTKR
jgi:hypothetical protein